MKKAILTTIICSVIVVGVALAGFTVYNKVLSNNEQNNQENNNQNNQENDEQTNNAIWQDGCSLENYNNCPAEYYRIFAYFEDTQDYYSLKYYNVFEYFEDINDLSITLNYCTNEIESEGEGGTFYKTADYNLNKTEIQEFLAEVKVNSISGFLSGGHSVQCGGELTFNYKVNGTKHKVRIAILDGHVYETTDSKIKNIIESTYTILPRNSNVSAPKGGSYSASLPYNGYQGVKSNILKNIVNRLNGK